MKKNPEPAPPIDQQAELRELFRPLTTEERDELRARVIELLGVLDVHALNRETFLRDWKAERETYLEELNAARYDLKRGRRLGAP